MLQPVNVIESNLALLAAAELDQAAGNAAAARASLAQFDKAWPQPPAFVSARLRKLRALLAR
jgi:hypothetical protein